MMPHYQCFGNNSPQLTKQRQHGPFLLQRPGIRGRAVRRQTAFVADTHRMPVVILAMRAHLLYRSSTVNLTVTGNVKMVTDIFEAAMMDMVMAASLEIQVPPLGGGGTMDDDKCYLTHTGRLNAALYSYDAAYSGSHCDNNFENDAPSGFSFLIFHEGKVLKGDTLKNNKDRGRKGLSPPPRLRQPVLWAFSVDRPQPFPPSRRAARQPARHGWQRVGTPVR